MQATWAERAEKEFGVPQGYFNLWPFREMGEEERYREIASLYELGPYSSVRLINGDTIEGVYESYAGLMQAVERNDVVMIKYFWSRLKPGQKLYLKENPPPTEGNFTASEFLYSLLDYPPIEERNIYEIGEEIVQKGLSIPEDFSTEVIFYMAERGYVPALERLETTEGHTGAVLRAAITSGNIAFLDRILPFYFNLLPDVSVSNIPILPFDIEEENFPLYSVSTDKPEEKKAYSLLASAARSCNVQVVDFFRSLYRVDVLPERSVIYLTQIHRRPVDALCILQRTDLQRVDFRYDGIWEYGDVNLMLYILLKKNVEKLPKRIIQHNLGNIPLLVTLLQLYPNYVPPNPETLEDLEMYPLTQAILYQ